ncbi:MAG: hypothetical protein AB1641_31435 [Thermodesulfobacteriota bacterium]
MSSILSGLAGEIWQVLTLIKIAVAVIMVLGLSLIAERASPRMAGIASGFPLGSAVTLFFIGLEVGPDFAGQSAVYTILGLTATQCFAGGYYLASIWTSARTKPWSVTMSAGAGLAMYAAASWAAWPLQAGWPLATAVTLAAVLLFDSFFKRIQNVKIVDRKKFGPAQLLARALFAAAIIVVITAAARIIGPKWSGLLSAFPTTMLPLMAIIHYSYAPEHVHAIIKNVPRGLVSLMIYCLAVYFGYAPLGVYWGTLAAYALAIVYLIVISVNHRPAVRRNWS